MTKSPSIVGYLTQTIIDCLNLPFKPGQEIYCGEGNINHMKDRHPYDFEKYYEKLEAIINNPDYVARHPNKENASIEYIKVFQENNGEHVLVAVRASGKSKLFVRTLFVMDPKKVEKYRNKNAFFNIADNF